MGWTNTECGQTCSECGCDFEEGEDAYMDGDDLYCEGCHEEEHRDEDDLIDGVGFADPGGHSSLRAATASNPRDQDCGGCGAENVLTRMDKANGYVCNRCADKAERGCD